MITLKNVSKWYGHFQVLTDCSTEVKKGEVVVVCGPSGSGKSTLIKTVNGLEPVQKGEITVNGIIVNDKKNRSGETAFPRGHGIPALRAISPPVDHRKPDAGAGESAETR